MDPQPSAAREGGFQLLQGPSRFLAGQDLCTPHHPLWISPFRRGDVQRGHRAARGCAGPAAAAQTWLSWAGTCARVSQWGRARAPPRTQPCLSTHQQWTAGAVESRPQEQSTQDLCCRPVSIATECLHGTLVSSSASLSLSNSSSTKPTWTQSAGLWSAPGLELYLGAPVLGRMLSYHHHFEIPKN